MQLVKIIALLTLTFPVWGGSMAFGETPATSHMKRINKATSGNYVAHGSYQVNTEAYKKQYKKMEKKRKEEEAKRLKNCYEQLKSSNKDQAAQKVMKKEYEKLTGKKLD